MRHHIVIFLVVIGFVLAACSSQPAPAPTLEPVLPPLPSATAAALLPSAAPETTPIVLGQGTPQPAGGAPSATCPAGGTTARLPGIRFGVNIAPGDPALDRSFDMARGMNAGWVRATLRWSDLEPQPGAYRWESLDALVAGIQSRGLRLLLAITQSPQWATADGSGGLPDKPTDFGTFLRALAGHTAGQVAAYEIWREPNSAAANGGTIAKPAQYAEVLKAAYGAIKSADPCALVLNGALLPVAPNTPGVMDDLAFYRAMLAASGGAGSKLYDILAVQLNTSGEEPNHHWSRLHPTESRAFYGHVSTVRDDMIAADQGDRQVWVVQVGYSVSGAFAVSAERQAEYLTDMFDLSRRNYSWISAIFVRDLGAAAAGEQAGYNLLDPDGTPRAAYDALRRYYGAAHEQYARTAPIKGTDQELLWQFWPNPEPFAQLALGPDGAIYSTTATGYVLALDPNGAFRLKIKPARKKVPGVAIDEQHIYATGDNGTLSAYSSGGDFTWNVQTDGIPNTPLLISADGRALYSGTSKDQLDAYATDDGHKLWGAPLGGLAGAPALGADGTIYVGSSDGALHALAPDGAARWRAPAGGWVRAAPLISGTAIFGATDKGAIFAVDTSGAQRWRAELGAEAVGLAAGPDGTLYATTGDGQLHALTPDGHSLWATQLGGGRPTAPAVGPDRRIYVGAERGGLRVITPDGATAGAFDVRASLEIAPQVGRDGAVYVAVGDRKDTILAFGTAALKERYNMP